MFSANAVTIGTPGQNWIAKSGPTRTYNNATYGNGTYLFVADQGYVASSTDANTWTEQLGLRSAGWLVAVYAIVYPSSLGYFVAGGSSGRIATSPDGVTWTLRSSLITAVESLLWDGSTMVSYGDSGLIYTSTNGISYTQIGYLSSLVGWASGAGPFASDSGAYGNGLFLVAGYGSGTTYCATSPNGSTWTNRPGINSATSGAIPFCAAWSPAVNRWFVGCSGGLVVTSSDASTWSAVSGLTSILAGNSVRTIKTVGNTVIVFADSGKVATSTDGVNWTNQPGLSQIGRSARACAQNGRVLAVNGFAVSV